MPRKKKDEKIAVVVDGKDVCRIIPFKPSDGRYDLKFDFLGNDFDTSCYRLFSHRPILWEIYDSNQFELTYHKGESDKPLRIHLKRKNKKDGLPSYQDLPLKRIQAPSINQRFPMPIVKLEVPSNIGARSYKSKGYHKRIEPEDCNVLEIYLAHANFDMGEFMAQLPGMQMAFMMLSFEVFATNTVMTDYQKGASLIPKDEPKPIMTSFSIMDDMKIIVIHFKDNQLNKRLSKIQATFIENELSESILAMMKIAYPPTSNNGIYDEIYLGGATLRDVDLPTFPLVKPPIGNNVIADAFKGNRFTSAEKDDLYWHALKLRIQLRDALIEHQQYQKETKKQLCDKVTSFIKAINIIGKSKEQLAEDESEWFSSYSKSRSVYISILVAKYLGMEQCALYARHIRQQSSGQLTFHAWLMYYDMFDIDASYSLLSEFTNLELEEIMVAPAEQHPILAEYAGVRHTIKENGYKRGPLKAGVYTTAKFDSYFDRNDRLLSRIYEKIVTAIDE